MELLGVIYIILGYWATGKTTHANKMFIGYKMGQLFIERLILGGAFGWALIPVAIIRSILGI